MTLLRTINRRLHINRAVRELSALNHHMLVDIGLDGQDLTTAVEGALDAKVQITRLDPVVLNHYPVSSGAAA